METEWIYNQLVTGVAPLFNKSGATTEAVDDELKRHIARFLELMHVQKLDVCVFLLTLTFIFVICYSPSCLLNCFIYNVGSFHCYVSERGDIESIKGPK